jgi:AcrR family transcriptional regulator
MSTQTVHASADPILAAVPKLWNDTIEAHRREVRHAILHTTAGLVLRNGLTTVTMSQIAEETGIGRATLYKYFPDVEAILVAWHEGHIQRHLEHLQQLGSQEGTAGERLQSVLAAYALIQHEHHGHQLASLLHRGAHIARAEQKLHKFLRDLLAQAAGADEIRSDIAPDELASYCLHALAGAGGLPSKAAVQRLVALTLAGLAPPR